MYVAFSWVVHSNCICGFVLERVQTSFTGGGWMLSAFCPQVQLTLHLKWNRKCTWCREWWSGSCIMCPILDRIYLAKISSQLVGLVFFFFTQIENAEYNEKAHHFNAIVNQLWLINLTFWSSLGFSLDIFALHNSSLSSLLSLLVMVLTLDYAKGDCWHYDAVFTKIIISKKFIIVPTNCMWVVEWIIWRHAVCVTPLDSVCLICMNQSILNFFIVY